MKHTGFNIADCNETAVSSVMCYGFSLKWIQTDSVYLISDIGKLTHIQQAGKINGMSTQIISNEINQIKPTSVELCQMRPAKPNESLISQFKSV